MKLLKFVIISAMALASLSANAELPAIETLPRNIYSGVWKAGHVQGIAVDAERKYMYFSFTTVLVKTDLEGNVVGTVTGLLGHLGCLEYNEADGRVYGSLEYKNDSIGKNILKREGYDKQLATAFYIAIFDVEKITRMDMSAEADGIMTTVCLPTAVEDYNAKVSYGGKEYEHRLGCSGIDGVSFGPAFGKSDGKQYLTVAYGIYRDLNRTDNDYQVLLQYDTTDWAKYEKPISQERMHYDGPAAPNGQYFVRTGNTSWGIQNLEYDKSLGIWFMAAYKGKKPQFANYTMFAIDATAKPVKSKLIGVPYIKKAMVLPLRKQGMHDMENDVYGWHFKYGTTGLCSLGDGYFYISHNAKNEEGQLRNAKLYRFVGRSEKAFELVK